VELHCGAAPFPALVVPRYACGDAPPRTPLIHWHSKSASGDSTVTINSLTVGIASLASPNDGTVTLVSLLMAHAARLMPRVAFRRAIRRAIDRSPVLRRDDEIHVAGEASSMRRECRESGASD
jgi:hypothetical protein